ncbi:hypothetical protein [Streptomyces flavidovirens]|uniref:hypothetical protein n=1 Tax=Streptomyces flavidovirens TaxID=67298 RepID=UPI0036C4C88B
MIGSLARVPPRLIALIMAFGSGVLMAAVSFELIDEAYERSGIGAVVAGAVGGGGAVYSVSGENALLARRGAQHRKRSGNRQPSEAEQPGSENAIALGALLDGRSPSPWSSGRACWAAAISGVATVGAVFISNPRRAGQFRMA